MIKIKSDFDNRTYKFPIYPPCFVLQEVSYYALLTAYRDCSKRKSNKLSTLKYEKNLMTNLLSLHYEINDGRYCIGRSKAFVVTEPKVREVWCADYKDRIIHHLIYNEIGQFFERRFIYDSYSCIKGKGTLFGAKRIYKFIRQATNNWDKPAYYLKMDIANYFMSIDREKLWNMVAKHFDNRSIIGILLRMVIFNDYKEDCIVIKRHMFDLVPKHKSAWYAPFGKGLPIGNLTSQFLSNIYLDGLDKFVKHDLRVKYYGRYVDDFVIIDRDKNKLKEIEAKIKDFLKINLSLEIADHKTIIDRVDKGVDFIGYKILPYRFLPRDTTVSNVMRKINSMGKYTEKIIPSINSYLGLLRHVKSYNVRKKICAIIKKKFNKLIHDKDYYKIITPLIKEIKLLNNKKITIYSRKNT